MRRTIVVLLSAIVLLGTVLVGGGAFATAQDTDLADHPLVGSWLVDTDTENPENLLELATIFADGAALLSSADGTTGHGAWEPTGDATANLTFVLVFEDGGRLTIRASAEVAADGQSFTSPYTNEFFDSSGQGSGEIGPGTAEGTLIEVEEPGTPVASFEEFFEQFEGTPEATPES
jgi:hypothetical protein